MATDAPTPGVGAARTQVKEAIDSNTLKRVAIKIVNLRQLRKVRNAEESVWQELKIHRKLKHPNVVELIEQFVLEEKQKLYAVLEYVSGGNLQDVANEMPEGVLPLHIASFFMRQARRPSARCALPGHFHRHPRNFRASSPSPCLLRCDRPLVRGSSLSASSTATPRAWYTAT